jgi:hypothetical protein
MFSFNHKFIFIHIPKTAGTSITNWLFKLTKDPSIGIFQHVNILTLENYLAPIFFNSYFKFTFVRNPWDRCVSFYHFCQQNESFGISQPDTQELIRNLTFPEYLQYHHPANQLCRIIGKDEKVKVDFIGKVEQINRDVQYIAQRLKFDNCPSLPFYNTSKHNHYSTYYDSKSKDLVYKYYKEEIKLFGYEYNVQ